MRSFFASRGAQIAAGCLACALACSRGHVDLARPCSTDNDCIEGYTCDSGVCTAPNTQVCTPSVEVCDGHDNDCDGNADDGFECTLGDRVPCGSGTSRLCKLDCTLSACTATWLDGAWPIRVPVIVTGEGTTQTLTNVPVPLRFNAATWNAVGVATNELTSDGRDVRVTNEAGTLLKHEIESWDATRGYVVWVLAPSIAPGASIKLWLYLGNTLATDASTSTVWDANFVGVWHFADAAGGGELRDSSTAGNNGTIGAVAASTGVFGSGQPYDGIQGARAGSASIPASSDLTVEGWFRPTGDAYPYRRVLAANVPVADLEVLWQAPATPDFQAHTGGDYTSIRVLEGVTPRKFAVLFTDHGTEVWILAPDTGNTLWSLVYGKPGVADGSNPPETFHFWANASLWTQLFSPEPSATTSGALTVTSGRLSTQLPFDMRDGYLVQNYSNYTQSPPESRQSAGLPHISSRANPTTSLNPATAGVFITKDPGVLGGSYRTSDGSGNGFDQGSWQTIGLLNTDVGIGINNGKASIFIDQTLAREITSNFASPLSYLLLGSYDNVADMYPTNYVAMLVRRWPGADTNAISTRERAGGIGIGDFAVGMQPSGVYATTNADSRFSSVGGSQPHHVALVVNGLTAHVYVDGVEKATPSVSTHGILAGMALGDLYSFNGVLDEVRLSKTARSADWIAFEVATASGNVASAGSVERLQ